MSQAVTSTTASTATSITALLVPLADRTLLLPNVAVAELIPYRAASDARHASLVSRANGLAGFELAAAVV